MGSIEGRMGWKVTLVEWDGVNGEWMDRWMDGWTNGWINEWIGWMDGWTNWRNVL